MSGRSSIRRQLPTLLLPLLLLVVAALVAPGGCFQSRNLPDGGTFLCAEYDPAKTEVDFCPEGFFCTAGICVRCADSGCPIPEGGVDAGAGPASDAATDAGPDSGSSDGGGA